MQISKLFKIITFIIIFSLSIIAIFLGFYKYNKLELAKLHVIRNDIFGIQKNPLETKVLQTFTLLNKLEIKPYACLFPCEKQSKQNYDKIEKCAVFSKYV